MNLLVCLEHRPDNDGHVALSRQIKCISKHMNISIDAAWEHPDKSVAQVSNANGVIVPNGPTPSFEAQVLCCKRARETQVPILGICGGLQAMAVDIARHLAGLREANSEEYDLTTTTPVVHKDGQLCIRGLLTVQLTSGGYLTTLYKSEAIEGIVRCGLFVNWQYWHRLEQAGLQLMATSPDRKRILGFRLRKHPFYVGVAFIPQLGEAFRKSEPLLTDFLRAIATRSSK